jgi:hypothetical protein
MTKRISTNELSTVVAEKEIIKRKRSHDNIESADLIKLRAEVERNSKRQALAAAKVAEANEKQIEKIKALRNELKITNAELKKKQIDMNAGCSQLSGNKRSITASTHTTDLTESTEYTENLPSSFDMEPEIEKIQHNNDMYAKSMQTSIELAKTLKQVN